MISRKIFLWCSSPAEIELRLSSSSLCSGPAPRSLLDVAAREAASFRRRGCSFVHARSPRPRARTRGAAACFGTTSSLLEDDDSSRKTRRDAGAVAVGCGARVADGAAVPVESSRRESEALADRRVAPRERERFTFCLLYTSDAADE